MKTADRTRPLLDSLVLGIIGGLSAQLFIPAGGTWATAAQTPPSIAPTNRLGAKIPSDPPG
jgi:hypothetical protein